MKHLHYLRSMRFLTGQLPVVGLLSVLLSGDIFNSPLSVKLLFALLTLSTVSSNFYFIKEIKEEKAKDNYKPNIMLNQIGLIIISVVLGVICIFRGMSNIQSYQQIIAFICATLCFIICALVVWGCKYINNISRK